MAYGAVCSISFADESAAYVRELQSKRIRLVLLVNGKPCPSSFVVPIASSSVRLSVLAIGKSGKPVVLAAQNVEMTFHGALMLEFVSSQTDVSARQHPIDVSKLRIRLVSSGPKYTHPAIESNLQWVGRALDEYYTRHVEPNVQSDAIPCMQCVFEGLPIPAAAYFQLSMTHRPSENLLIGLFQYACYVSGCTKFEFEHQEFEIQGEILARMCTLFATSMEYTPDLTLTENGDEVPCNEYASWTSWKGDCEECTQLSLATHHWIATSQTDELAPIRALAQQYDSIAVIVSVETDQQRMQHTHGLLIPRDEQFPPLLLEGTVRTSGVVRPGRLPARFPSSKMAERPAIEQDGRINGWYDHALVAFWGPDTHHAPDEFSALFPSEHGAIGVPLVEFMQHFHAFAPKETRYASKTVEAVHLFLESRPRESMPVRFLFVRLPQPIRMFARIEMVQRPPDDDWQAWCDQMRKGGVWPLFGFETPLGPVVFVGHGGSRV